MTYAVSRSLSHSVSLNADSRATIIPLADKKAPNARHRTGGAVNRTFGGFYLGVAYRAFYETGPVTQRTGLIVSLAQNLWYISFLAPHTGHVSGASSRTVWPQTGQMYTD